MDRDKMDVAFGRWTLGEKLSHFSDHLVIRQAMMLDKTQGHFVIPTGPSPAQFEWPANE